MRRFTLLALAVAIVLAAAFSPFASSSPDGLEKVAERQGFADRGRLAPVQERAPVPDYAIPGFEDARLATALAGVAGVLGVFALGAGVALVVRRPRTA
jgi:PDGLE domain